MKQFSTIFFTLLFFSSYSQDFSITHFDSNITINTDGSYDVVETIDVFFKKKKRGIYRDIPRKYKIDGKLYDIGINNIEVIEEKSKIKKSRDKVNIRLGDKNKFIKGDKQYKIKYSLQSGVLNQENHQEVYYDITGNEWNAEIEKVSYTLNLPKSITIDEKDMKITTGFDKEIVEGASIHQVSSRKIKGETTRKLRKGEGVTIATRLPKTYLEVAGNGMAYVENNDRDNRPSKKQNPWLALIPVGLLASLLRVRQLFFKGNKADKNPEMQYYGPKDITSAHVGTFIDQTANTRDVISLLPYWAAEGYIIMQNVDDEIELSLKESLPESFPEYEHLVFDYLFKERTTVLLSDVKEKFYTTLYKAKDLMTKEVNAQGYYNESFTKYFRSWRFIFVPLGLLILGLYLIIGIGQIIGGVACIIIGVLSTLVLLGQKPLSPYGIKMQNELNGLKKFITEMPTEKVKEMVDKDPEYFNKIFPFAIAFGIEKNFIKEMTPFYNDYNVPWFTTTGTDQSNITGSNIVQLGSVFKVETIDSAFSSSPPSHNGSGSGGGGFSSGGGVGGGGGGSW